MTQINHCRFCGKAEFGKYSHSRRLIKYGTRHYAHPRCYLEAGKDMGALRGHAIRSMDVDGLTKDQRDQRDRLIRIMDLLGNG
jgi:hypothetical protein